MHFRMLLDETGSAVSYLLADLESREAVAIDARPEDRHLVEGMLSEHRLHLRWWLVTHEHGAGREDALAADVDRLGARLVRKAVPEQRLLPFGDELVEVLATPGHTEHCLSFRWRDRLFCGDLFAVGDCPSQPWPALPARLWDSAVGSVLKLPPETLLFHAHPVHGRAVSTVLEELRCDAWFSAPSRDEFMVRLERAAAGRGPRSPSSRRPQTHLTTR